MQGTFARIDFGSNFILLDQTRELVLHFFCRGVERLCHHAQVHRDVWFDVLDESSIPYALVQRVDVRTEMNVQGERFAHAV